MAIIQDHSSFKIKVRPEYTNWWSFYFEFLLKDKPIFNPEIARREEGIKADEYESYPLLPVLEKAIESKIDGETFGWGAWENETEIEIKTVTKNLDEGVDCAFDFTVLLPEHAFRAGDMDYMSPKNVMVRLSVSRDELRKFCVELKREMSHIAKKATDELSQKNDKGGYDAHIKFLKQYIIEK